jgi:hypothetical protein
MRINECRPETPPALLCSHRSTWHRSSWRPPRRGSLGHAGRVALPYRQSAYVGRAAAPCAAWAAGRWQDAPSVADGGTSAWLPFCSIPDQQQQCGPRRTHRLARLLMSDRPGALPRPALLRTGRAPFNASGSSRPCWRRGERRCWLAACEAVGVDQAGFSDARHAGGRHRDHLDRGAVADQPAFPAGCSATISRRALISPVTVSRCVSAAGVRFLAILLPPRS